MSLNRSIADIQYEAALSGGIPQETLAEAFDLTSAIVDFNLVRLEAVSYPALDVHELTTRRWPTTILYSH